MPRGTATPVAPRPVAEAQACRYARVLEAPEDATVMFGGESLGPHFINFVLSSREHMRQIADDWQAGRMELLPNDDREFVPLPECRGAL